MGNNGFESRSLSLRKVSATCLIQCKTRGISSKEKKSSDDNDE
jgi:hypothetical protein